MSAVIMDDQGMDADGGLDLNKVENENNKSGQEEKEKENEVREQVKEDDEVDGEADEDSDLDNMVPESAFWHVSDQLFMMAIYGQRPARPIVLK